MATKTDAPTTAMREIVDETARTSITENPNAAAAAATAKNQMVLVCQELFGELRLFIFVGLADPVFRDRFRCVNRQNAVGCDTG